jgi:carboxypeptidase PM20D1
MELIFTLIGLALVLLLGVLLVRTLLFVSRQAQDFTAVDFPGDGEQAVRRLAGALSFATVAYEDPEKFIAATFRDFHAWLAETYPAVHAALRRETIGEFGLLYTWPGQDQSLKPILLMAHQDVVPVSPETQAEWTHPPFAGEIASGYVWGRGALDDKSSLMGILEAVEALLDEGFQPQRTVYLAFGQDEEIGGRQGSARIAELLRSRVVGLEYVLDEGGFVTEGMIPGVPVPVALVGIAEKGYLTLELSVAGPGGHSSIPVHPTTIGILSQALSRLEDNPFPADMTYLHRLFAIVGPDMPFGKRLVLANLWLFEPLVAKTLSKSAEMNAMLRTTAAPTMLSAGVKENVLPAGATAVVNFRILPGETVDEVIARVEKIVADPRVTIRAREVRSEPSPVSDVDSASYRMLERTIRQTAGGALLIAPYLVAGATDSRHYNDLADNIYRYSFLRLAPEDVVRIHGTDERIAVENYREVIRFYYQLLRNSQEMGD